MALRLLDLDDETRGHMVSEVQHDIVEQRLYVSRRLSPAGAAVYPEALLAAARSGDDRTLALALSAPGVMRSHEMSSRRGKPYSKRVPHDAHEMLAEGEFNRFYIRGLCASVIALGGYEVEIYRARPSSQPRSSSLRLEGMRLDAERLLDDLRTNQGVEPALGLPPGPNSGLSVRHPRD